MKLGKWCPGRTNCLGTAPMHISLFVLSIGYVNVSHCQQARCVHQFLHQHKERFNKWVYSAEQTATMAHIKHATQKIDSGLVSMPIKSVILGERTGNRRPACWQHLFPFHIRAKPLIATTGMRVALSKLQPLAVSNHRRHRQ